jgi:hypothetical protein
MEIYIDVLLPNMLMLCVGVAGSPFRTLRPSPPPFICLVLISLCDRANEIAMEISNGDLQWRSPMEISNGDLQWRSPMDLCCAISCCLWEDVARSPSRGSYPSPPPFLCVLSLLYLVAPSRSPWRCQMEVSNGDLQWRSPMEISNGDLHRGSVALHADAVCRCYRQSLSHFASFSPSLYLSRSHSSM